MRSWLVLVLFACATSVMADATQPIVTVEVSPAEVVVGQPIRLRVTVLVPTWFTNPSTYPSFELANTITRLPADSSFNTSVRVNGEAWAGISRDYQINPQIAAVYNLEGLQMRVNYAHPETRQSTPVDVAIPTISFSAVVPNAAAALNPFLAGTHGSLEREVDNNLEGLQTGDAIVVTVTAKLRGMPAMFLPELIPPTEQPGLTAYPKEPIIEEGEVAKRTEQVTYVFSGGGSFTLPQLSLAWWNPTTEQIERATVDPLVVFVAGPAALSLEQQVTPNGLSWLIILGWLVAFAALAAVIYLLNNCVRALAKWRIAQAALRQASEPYAFRELMQTLQQGNPTELDLALRVWLKRLDGQPSLPEFSLAGGSLVYEDILALNRSRHGADPHAVKSDMTAIAEHLQQSRAQYLSRQRTQFAAVLPTLNPPCRGGMLRQH